DAKRQRIAKFLVSFSTLRAFRLSLTIWASQGQGASYESGTVSRARRNRETSLRRRPRPTSRPGGGGRPSQGVRAELPRHLGTPRVAGSPAPLAPHLRRRRGRNSGKRRSGRHSLQAGRQDPRLSGTFLHAVRILLS